MNESKESNAQTFEELNLSEELMFAIKRLGFSTPTQIQAEAIPLLMEGKDVIGQSATGSGKTLAFGAGIIEQCTPKEQVQAIVLVPTRELAEQVKDDIKKLNIKKKLTVMAVYGGVSISPQIEMLRRADVVIGTPGRMLDHLNRGTIDTSKVRIMILDEADRMVEMGFIEDVEQIMRACPKDKQTLLFSATMYGPAEQIARRYMNDPQMVFATKMVDPTKLKQIYYDVPGKLKKELVIHLLKKEETDLVMVFCNTRRMVDILVRVMRDNGVKAAPIHGGMSQSKRLLTIDQFHKGKFRILVCTDVAARGLHIEGVSHIYNYDVPTEPSDYVHRIGRTARAGGKGIVVNLIATQDYDSFDRLLRVHHEFNIGREERPYLDGKIVDNSRQMGNRDSSRRNDSRGSRNSGSYGRGRSSGRGGSRGSSSGGQRRSGPRRS
mgnify:CR=1 FL=1|jgi:ATP-dependent RNA helicase DeaD